MAKSAFAAIVGRPSSGKSTLLNALCGAKVSIVSPVPQTTRNTVRGIVNRPAGQIVFLDTPGFHISEKKLNLRLRDLVLRALADADIVVYLIDATREPGPEEEVLAKALQGVKLPMVAAINKVDDQAALPDRAAAFVAEQLPQAIVLRLSAKLGTGLDELLEALLGAAQEGPAWYPEEYYTDQEPVFRMAEIVREKIILHTREELPHAVFVDFTDSRKLDDGGIEANFDIVVERESQKGIVIGKGGARLREVGTAARTQIEKLLGTKVYLDLRVKIAKNWQRDPKQLGRLGF